MTSLLTDINSNTSLTISGSKDGSVHWKESVEFVKFSPSFATVPMAATGGMDNKLVIWDLQHSTPRLLGNCVHTFHGHLDAVQAISVSTNTDFIVSVSVDYTACV
uniref:Uncharacterized protein n=1 Tax=Brassica oleracea var. oleracea TaxID=109376 RepID=A0A0D3CX99_BRAOL